MTYSNRIPKYFYIHGSLKDHTRDRSNKVHFILNPGELERYCESVVTDIHDRFSHGFKTFIGDYRLEIIHGKNGSESQVKIIVEMPEKASAEWLKEEAMSCWRGNAIAGDVIFAEVFEACSMDEGFLQNDHWKTIRGVQLT